MKEQCILLATIFIVEGLLYFFYNKRNRMPLQRTKLLKKIIILTMANTLLSMILYHAAQNPPSSGLQMIYIWEILYFTLYDFIFFLIFKYILVCSGQYISLKQNIICLIPLFIIVFLSAFSFYNKSILNICDYGHFRKENYFLIVNSIPFIYFIQAQLNRAPKDKMSSTERKDYKGFIVASVIFTAGIFITYTFNDIHVMDSVLFICLFFNYITAENPEYYISHITNTYNMTGLEHVIKDYQKRKKPFYYLGIHVRNLKHLNVLYNTCVLSACEQQFAEFLKKTFKDSYIFFDNRESFIIFSEQEFDDCAYMNIITKRCSRPFRYQSFDINFAVKFFVFEKSSAFSNVNDLLNAELYAHEFDASDDSSVLEINTEFLDSIEKSDCINALVLEAIATGNILVYFQPLYSTASRNIKGAEALVRLAGHNGQLIFPDAFIPASEKNGRIVELGYAIFDKICSFVHDTHLTEKGIEFINVNLSPVQFDDNTLIDRMTEIAKKYDVDFSMFNFEITESATLNAATLYRRIYELQKLGATISLDDFGKGSSNIERLLQIPFNAAKLDMTLVWDYFGNKNTIMQYVINIFKSEDLKIVAEGVETKDMARKLSELGCDYLQGYYFSKPVSPEDFIIYVRKMNGC